MDFQKAQQFYSVRPTLMYDPLGLPYVGPAHLFKDVDSDDNKPQRIYRAHAAVFNTWNKQHLEVHTLIKGWISRGWGLLGVEKQVALPDQGGWCIFMRWADAYCQVLTDADKAQRTIRSPDGDVEAAILDYQVCGRVLNTSDPEDLAAYVEMFQKIMNGVATLDSEAIEFTPKGGSWLIFTQWREYFLRNPGPDGR